MTNSESIENHIRFLQEKHDLLDREIIRVENTHRNQSMIIDLKKKKLKLKDEIESLKKQLLRGSIPTWANFEFEKYLSWRNLQVCKSEK